MAQTKRVTVELGFKANTDAVKKNINELAANLKQISNIQIGLKGSDLDQAKKAAKESEKKAKKEARRRCRSDLQKRRRVPNFLTRVSLKSAFL